VDREVEKCFEDGTRGRGSVVVGAGGWDVAEDDDDWFDVEFTRKRDWLEWLEK